MPHMVFFQVDINRFEFSFSFPRPVTKKRLKNPVCLTFSCSLRKNPLVWFGLVWFNGTLTIVGYLMPNPVFSYISNIYVNIFCRNTVKLSNSIISNNSILHKSIKSFQVNSIKYKAFVYIHWSNSSISNNAV